MSTGYGEGEGRVRKAIDDALNSPLLNDNDIFNAKKILLSINFSKDKNEKSEQAGLMMEEMNDVNDFMEKFGSDFEIKWGMALDPDLGKKVKVTILATGFGMKDVDGMDEERISKYTQQDAEEKQREIERQLERERQIAQYYSNDKTGTNKKRPNIYLFRSEDLDNDNIILDVEATPTYKRSRQAMEGIRQKSTPRTVVPETKPEENNVTGTIHFGG